MAYTYRAEVLCPACVLGALRAAVPAPAGTENALDDMAKAYGIDRYDESSFDSGTFPKVVFRDHLDAEHARCGDCGEEL